MDFFTKQDWFNRPGPYAFTAEHFLFIATVTLLGILLGIALRRVSKKTVKATLVALWAFLVFVDLFKWIIVYLQVIENPIEHPFNLETMLPLHSCSFFMYVFPFAIWSKNEAVKKASRSFLVSVNMIMGFITLFVGFGGKNASVFSFFGLHTLLFHAIIFIVPLIMLITEFYIPKAGDIKYGLSLFLLFTVIIFVFDWITGCDYMYIFDGHTFGVLKFIYENVHHLVWTLISVGAYIITALATHFLIVLIFKIIRQHS